MRHCKKSFPKRMPLACIAYNPHCNVHPPFCAPSMKRLLAILLMLMLPLQAPLAAVLTAAGGELHQHAHAHADADGGHEHAAAPGEAGPAGISGDHTHGHDCGAGHCSALPTASSEPAMLPTEESLSSLPVTPPATPPVSRPERPKWGGSA
ncbi:hypothetical protein [Azospira restricta]|uniref:Uncharacterized protein n=1 Tax=Azospira restricta TaxID=404405 RepID=A0A974SM47_9RHOO|nr:hypothetical protein [Azospira restricta]QRJ62122.1 hypothetical protein IWH25_09885 [Azospira restricta]